MGRGRDEPSRAHSARSFRILVLDAFEYHNKDAVDIDGIVREAVDDIHVTVVINCAGAGPRPTFAPLARCGRQDILTIHLNAAFSAFVTWAVIPVLRNSTSPALLLNIASVSDVGLPLVSFYGAPEAFRHMHGLSAARPLALLPRRAHRGQSRARAHQVATARASSPIGRNALQRVALAVLPTALADSIMIETMRERSTEQDAAAVTKEA
ncbi:hypothetical protein DL766_001784 [Monosporascus sp. MC13-8B]|uniref:Ketoreductase (KR) domain-containing protein n=1 Tax=Monosporascus cannonballus TaxID=155416 RepID=A0ABY0HFJ7_9PEZI|nr:hypothetical protein DL762_001742 [Monosporascus cannonballus]RYO99463.1 hypothetical protein DL763_001487 [Monosporascus cannonballus]RYP36906.1 hypothetical protein DL766_001784 [Monosporascus sp. MC13-8B]